MIQAIEVKLSPDRMVTFAEYIVVAAVTLVAVVGLLRLMDLVG